MRVFLDMRVALVGLMIGQAACAPQVLAPLGLTEIAPSQYAIERYGTLHIALPPLWESEIEEMPGWASPTAVLRSPSEPRTKVLVSVSWVFKRHPGAYPRMSKLKTMVTERGTTALQDAVETQLSLEELHDPNAPATLKGFYFGPLTDADKNMPPEEYRYFRSGLLRDKMFVFAFTILSDSPDVPQALNVVSSLRVQLRDEQWIKDIEAEVEYALSEEAAGR